MHSTYRQTYLQLTQRANKQHEEEKQFEQIHFKSSQLLSLVFASIRSEHVPLAITAVFILFSVSHEFRRHF